MSKASFNSIIPVADDGLIIAEVGEWAIEKYKLVGMYSELFTNSMHDRWDNLVYIDLFSGCGYSKVRKQNKIIMTSPLISLSLPHRFTRYIFCDLEVSLLNALETRIKRDFKNTNCEYVLGDCNNKIQEIIDLIPRYSKDNTVLSFCFIDPFAISGINFNTIEKLAHFAMDFLILIPTGMDAKRNFKYFVDVNNDKIDHFLNDKNWRIPFMKNYQQTNSGFLQFLVEEFDRKMMTLQYLKPEAKQLIRSTDKNLPLYHLAFYSKHKRGNFFWKEVKKYSTEQTNLFS